MATKYVPRPFLKWVGGKTKMLGHIRAHVPVKVNRFYEPFLGGGSVFFDLYRNSKFEKATLGDLNPELVNSYKMIRDNIDEFIACLQGDKFLYEKEAYLAIRKEDPDSLTLVERAARFTYLNRTCFNGLYRVNKSGKFNTPFGAYANPIICDEVNLRAISKALRKTRIECADFARLVKTAKAGDLVYLDPPYFPISETSNFVGYTGDGFGLAEHTNLSIVFSQLAEKGVSVILSNSSCPTTRQLYRDHRIIDLVGSRNIGGPASYRNSVTEIMVVANTFVPESRIEPEVQVSREL